MMAALRCPVCEGLETAAFVRIGARAYWHCGSYETRFMDPAARLKSSAEHAHYKLHENDIHDPAYRRFLSKLAEPLMAVLLPGAMLADAQGWTCSFPCKDAAILQKPTASWQMSP